MFTACEIATEGGEVSLGSQQFELDEMSRPPEGMELFVLADGASVPRVREAFERLSGTFVHHLPPRMVVGKVPAGADALLRESGVVARFARAVSPSELPGLDTRESRFVRVFSSRYYPEATPAGLRVQPMRRLRGDDEPFETSEAPAEGPLSVLKASLPDDQNAELNERNVFVPYASGRIVVSIILPESNGRGEASTEDWSDQSIAEVYAKIQAGLEVVARHEPNAKLSFVMHYESAPAEGGLEGTVDVDWEYGKQVASGAHLGETYSQIFRRLLNREVGDYWGAQADYLAGLKERYSADGAYIVYVAANQNFTAGFRAYAYFNGPMTTLDSGYGYEVFAHEFGHIFGAMDEYCPDACVSPSSLGGYLGIVNANAQFQTGSWGGVRGGKGESQPSLMMANIANGVNGYTRGAWGWVDSDGDGLVEVRDTSPSSDVHVEVAGTEARIVGRIVDVPATPNWATPYSVNRIRAVQLRRAGTGSWVSVPVVSDRRGREDVDIALGSLRPGHYELELRGENSVGNLQPTPARLSFDVTGNGGNGRPLVSLRSDIDVLSPSASAGVTASVLDLDGDVVHVRYDIDGDGRYDTPFAAANRTVWVTPTRAGLLNVRAEARDARGATATAVKTLYVLEKNAPALPGLPLAPSPVVGSARHRFEAVGEVNDPERGRPELNYKLELDDALRSEVRETGFGVPRATVFDVETPASLAFSGLDLTQLDWSVERWSSVTDAVRFSHYMAFALGDKGVMVVDIANLSAPRLVVRLPLQTSAWDLALVGTSKLFVWGDKLTVVDVSNPEQPFEILQQSPTYNTRLSERRDPWLIGEGGVNPLGLWTWFQEDIEGVRVEVALDHPAWEELRVSLLTPNGHSFLLWDHAPRAPGQTSIVLDDESSEQLTLLLGSRAQGEFRIEVIDDVLNGSTGTITLAQLAFDTVHRAFKPALLNVSGIAGSIGERSLVLYGESVETVDIRQLDALRTDDVLSTSWVNKAHVVGNKLLLATQPEDWTGQDRPRGLIRVNAQDPLDLRVEAFDPSVRADAAFALAGTRFYASSWQDSITRVGSLASYLAGQPYWLGQSALLLSGDIAGDDSTLWRVYGGLDRIDVRNPNDLRVLEHYDDPIAYNARFLDGRTALLLASAGENYVVDLDSRVNLISEVYRLTAQARDPLKAQAEVSRSVHVVPYDHAPWISGARFLTEPTTSDYTQLEVSVVDPDGHPSWDGFQAVRIDWDGDGIYDGNWQGVWDTSSIWHLYTEPGDYQVRIQARDGFYALSNEVVVPVHVRP